MINHIGCHYFLSSSSTALYCVLSLLSLYLIFIPSCSSYSQPFSVSFLFSLLFPFLLLLSLSLSPSLLFFHSYAFLLFSLSFSLVMFYAYRAIYTSTFFPSSAHVCKLHKLNVFAWVAYGRRRHSIKRIII